MMLALNLTIRLSFLFPCGRLYHLRRSFRPLFDFQQSDQIASIPQTVCNASSHCWTHSQAPMNLDEVVSEIIQCDSRRMVLNLSRESVRESSVAPHRRSHAPILSLYKAGADVLRIRFANYRNGAAPDALGRTVARF